MIPLILSDVIGDDLDSIASGPCVPDPKTFQNCITIFEKYGITELIPASVVKHIESGTAGLVPETPKHGDQLFAKSVNVIIGGNFDALLQAKLRADQLGYNTVLLSSMIEGETKDVALNHVSMAREVLMHGYPAERPACILSGGKLP